MRDICPRRRRSFLFLTSTSGWHSVLCRNCERSPGRRRNHALLERWADAHDCPGVETKAEMEAREAAQSGGGGVR